MIFKRVLCPRMNKNPPINNKLLGWPWKSTRLYTVDWSMPSFHFDIPKIELITESCKNGIWIILFMKFRMLRVERKEILKNVTITYINIHCLLSSLQVLTMVLTGNVVLNLYLLLQQEHLWKNNILKKTLSVILSYQFTTFINKITVYGANVCQGPSFYM